MERSESAKHRQPTAAVLSVGTELTEGTVRDAHGSYIAGELRAIGIRTLVIAQIPDDAQQFKEELARLVGTCDLVIMTGGLGPTSDDLCRETVAEVGGVALEFHAELWTDIEKRFSGRTLSQTNRKQALIPAGFAVIPNPYGTAPAFWGRIGQRPPEAGGVVGVTHDPGTGDALVVALPGPPRELRPLFQDSVLPMLSEEFARRPSEELRATTFLLSESLLEQLLQEHRQGEVEWGTRAEAFRIVVTLRGGSAAAREQMFAALVERIGWLRLRRGEVTAHELVLEALKRSDKTLAAAESCTGGLIGKLVTDLAGASEHFWGSLVVYSNDAKSTLLAVSQEVIESHGAVSAETVAAMVEGVLGVSGADIGCAVSGIAGPSGGTPDKPVGTVWIGAGGKGSRVHTRRFIFSGDRDMVRRKSAVAALLMADGTIRGKEVDKSDLWQYI